MLVCYVEQLFAQILRVLNLAAVKLGSTALLYQHSNAGIDAYSKWPYNVTDQLKTGFITHTT
jgi:hypothetical protein